jgi:hypothetical protein
MNRLTLCAIGWQLVFLGGCSNLSEQAFHGDEVAQDLPEDPVLTEQLRVAGATVLQEAWAWRKTHGAEWDNVPLSGSATTNHQSLQSLRIELLRALLHANVIFHGITEVVNTDTGARRLETTGEPEITLERFIDNLHVTVRKGDFNGEPQYFVFKVGEIYTEEFKDTFSKVSMDIVSNGQSQLKIFGNLNDLRYSRTRDGSNWKQCGNLAAQRGFSAWHELNEATLQTMFCGQNPICHFEDLIAQNGEWQVLNPDVSSGQYCTVFNPNVAADFDPTVIQPAVIPD